MLDTKNKKSVPFNKNLDSIKYKAIQVFDELKYSGVPFTMEDLVKKIKGDEEKPTLLAEFLESRINELKLRVLIDITPTT